MANNPADNTKKLVGFIDVTQTWESLLPLVLNAYVGSDAVKSATAAGVLKEMARLADKHVRAMRYPAESIALLNAEMRKQYKTRRFAWFEDFHCRSVSISQTDMAKKHGVSPVVMAGGLKKAQAELAKNKEHPLHELAWRLQHGNNRLQTEFEHERAHTLMAAQVLAEMRDLDVWIVPDVFSRKNFRVVPKVHSFRHNVRLDINNDGNNPYISFQYRSSVTGRLDDGYTDIELMKHFPKAWMDAAMRYSKSSEKSRRATRDAIWELIKKQNKDEKRKAKANAKT